MPAQSQRPDPRVLEAAADSGLLRSVISLADRHRGTLGFLPDSVFGQRAAAGHVLAALDDDGTLLGYTVFDVARGRVRLIQLCVAPGRRRGGVARAIVDAISARHGDLPGIRVSCRADYAAATLWPRLDFTLMGEIPGRGRERKPLEIWWRSHGVPDLFSTMIEDDHGLLVAVDHNVFIDLAISPTRSGAAESQVLADDWLASRIALVVTRETYNEMQGLPVSDRAAQRAAASAFRALEPDRAALASARRALARSLDPALLTPPDLAHVLNAAAGGARVLATRDDELIRTASDAAQGELGLAVMRPSDLALHIDELEHADRYRPAALRGTGYRVQDTGPGTQDELAGLISTDTGERRSDYSARLRRLLSAPGHEHQHVRDGDGRIVAAWTLAVRGPVWTVPYLRSGKAPLARTVQRLVIFDWKRRAVAHGATEIRVTEKHLGREVAASLDEEGFVFDGDDYSALLVDARSGLAALAALPEGHDLTAAMGSEGLSPEQIARIERRLWPVKLLDGAMAAYVVSIQPRWANELFGLVDTLFERASLLGLSREHVYYRSRRGNPPAPARLLWYASKQGPDGIGAVVATSQLVEVVTDTPRRLFRRYAHLGVYRLEDIEARAADGVASALRFVDTERFPRPVPLDRLRSLGAVSRTAPLLSPTQVEPRAYGLVYEEGTGRHGH